MKWGFFSITHIISLIVGVGIIVGLYFILRNKSQKTQIITLGILSFSGIAAIIYNLVAWNSPLEYLPLHLCSLNALILPITVLTKNKILGNVLLVWCLGALFALIVNSAMAETEIFSWQFFFYYFPHVLEFGIPILLFAFGLIEKDVKCIFTTVGITMVIYTIIHFINLGLNNYFIENNILDYAGNVLQVNYMFSIKPENPLLDLFYKVIPYKYWYMYLIIPILVIYLSIIYFPQIKIIIQRKNTQN